ncbi:myelocytomatosis oncogene homolog [Kryptolebias marmoratus]|uniref:Myelocytomatosis oncogene homolog n=1 Tax=Kryptolebias marmoratus TaxID=37003 RepID=A0A3Q3AWW8_KRYMA|nr:myelocytomatosis oncogene homolog [Kryptolebias marmoratus]XP_037831394.1 myelocytomatosis oncogene homolog [Kryptolebias marmoratus]
MLQSFSQSPDWLYTEPLLFDDEFCQSLMKDLQSLPTPPQSPPMKADLGGEKPLTKEDQLSYVSDILLEDHDMQQLGWTCDFFSAADEKESCQPCSPLEEAGEDLLWRCLAGDKGLEEKLMLGSSPPLADIDASIFEEIAGSALDFQSLMGSQETSESTSDYGSTGGEMSTYSSSDSEEEIDVVTVVRCPSSLSPLPDPSTCKRKQEEEQRALQRHHFEIQLQHNYAAPCPASPPPKQQQSSSSNKRSRGSDGSSRYSHSSRSSSSSSSRYHFSSRNSTETEDEEERRRTHNVMERQRRNELKNCFLRLRDNVPELSHNDKASKVVILKKARDCIYGLEDESHRLQSKRDKLRARQEALKTRLELLRS